MRRTTKVHPTGAVVTGQTWCLNHAGTVQDRPTIVIAMEAPQGHRHERGQEARFPSRFDGWPPKASKVT